MEEINAKLIKYTLFSEILLIIKILNTRRVERGFFFRFRFESLLF